MQVRLKLFSILRQKLGQDEIFLDLQPGTRVEDLLPANRISHPFCPIASSL